PARKSAEVTRAIAARLAAVSKALEEHKHQPEDVAMFLMRWAYALRQKVPRFNGEFFRNRAALPLARGAPS
ncbi:MAG TPA: hypothetical protein VLW83_08630, partial [Candidatus Acidoferrales bacterium]|nr:hypothetical protein [Candidatus Acidoferrales bacterium]